MHRFPNKLIVYLQLLLFSNLLYLIWTYKSSAQDAGKVRRIVIGDILGRTDILDVKIPTKKGLIPVFGEGDSKPFHIIHQSPTELVLQLNTKNNPDSRHINQIVYRLYRNERALISALILEEVDFAILENEESALEVLNSNPNIRPIPITLTTNTVKMICYNLRHTLFKSKNVRLALVYGINRMEIIRELLGNKADLARGPFNSDSPYYTSQLKLYRYNPKRALRLLRKEGWRDTDHDRILDKEGIPFRFQLLYARGLTLDEAIARRIKIYLNKIGIDVVPKPATRRQINEALGKSNFEAVLLDHTFADNVKSLVDFFSAKGNENFTGYKSNTFERYVLFYYKTQNPKTRKTLIQSMQNLVNKDQPVNFLYFKWLTHYMINIKKFTNFRDHEGNIRPFEEWIIRPSLEK
ncbi:MAG: hypothetical protein D6813_10215 [Calditrichaeota bacterium]|nr:MAG: hypothetical protein D6813_10215 [Calditrichota bacterium]